MTLAELVDPDAHEPLTGTAWDEARARGAIGAIAAETEAAFDDDELWPAQTPWTTTASRCSGTPRRCTSGRPA